jgi:DNA mismatch endonuclease (patch repair protein)
MADVLSPQQRSYCMSRIRGKNTKPEYTIRKGLFALGFRYRLHQRTLPGCPDLVLPKYRAVIFVHGCLWHRHKCALFHWPKTNALFWRRKINKNRKNDQKYLFQLESAGWRVMTVWECTIRGRRRLDFSLLMNTIVHWLSSRRKRAQIPAR